MKQRSDSSVGKSRPDSESGFSLPEVLISVAILAIIATALAGMFTLGLQLVYGAKKITEATVLAQHVMEELSTPQGHNLLDPLSTDTVATQTFDMASTVETVSDGANFAVRNGWRQKFRDADLQFGSGAAQMIVAATPQPAGATFANAEIIHFEVQVTYAERGRRNRTVHLESLNLRGAE